MKAGRRKFLRAAALTGTGLLLPVAACEAAAGRREIEQLTLVVDWEGGGPPLDLTRGPATPYQFYCLSAALEGLLYLDGNARLQPKLAESWSNPDPLTYIFKLRDGVRFWDGSPLTPDDVIYSLTRHAEEQWASNFAWLFPKRYDSIEASAEGHITFRLREPHVYFAAAAGMPAAYIVKADFARRHVRDIGTSSVRTMGTGPFRLAHYAADERIDLVRNEHYWGAKPAVKRIILRAIEDDASQYLALQADEIDGSLQVPPVAAQRWKRTRGLDVISYASARCWWAAFDRDVQPLGDLHVRRALAYSLDRVGLSHVLFRGQARLAQAFAPPETWNDLCTPEEIAALYAALPANSYDLDQARAELAQSSVPRGFELTVPVEAMPESEKIMQVWQAGLFEIGVRLNLESVSRDEYRARFFRRTRPVGIFVTEWGTEYPDPLWNTAFTVMSQQAQAGSWNVSNLRSPEVDTLLERCQAASDPTVRAPLARQITQLLAADLGFYYLFWPDQAVAFQRRKVAVEGFKWWASFSPLWTTLLQPPT